MRGRARIWNRAIFAITVGTTSVRASICPPPVHIFIAPDDTFTWNGVFVANIEALERRMRHVNVGHGCKSVRLVPSPHASFAQVGKVTRLAQRYHISLGLVGNVR